METLQINKQEILNFIEDGLQVKYNFLSPEIINALRQECTELFSNTQLMGPSYSVRLSRHVFEVPQPTAKLTSINLLEVAIDIAEEIKKLGFENYKFAHVALYNEENNPKELVWHSDMRNGGLIRAQICIQGGDLNSGAFKYCKGSHKIADGKFSPPEGYLDEHKDDIIICNKPNGSLFLINTLGYHSKCICNENRISLMFDFLPSNYIIENPNDCASDILITSSRLSDKVIQNIDLFKNGVSVYTKSVNTPDNYKFYKPMAGANIKDITTFLKKMILRKLNN